MHEITDEFNNILPCASFITKAGNDPLDQRTENKDDRGGRGDAEARRRTRDEPCHPI